jgi:hypothetical protein
MNWRIVSVGGDGSFGGYVRLLDAFGIPWAILCDGPALRIGSSMYDGVAQHPRLAGLSLPDRDDFASTKKWWEQAGVFSLADVFGDDGTKSGEFEAFLRGLDSDAIERAHRGAGRSKARQGMLFASEVPCPSEITAIWQRVCEWMA